MSLTFNKVGEVEKVALLGRGAMGAVWKVKVKDDDSKTYAMKTVDLAGMKQSEQKRALNEVKVLKKFDHQNIVRFVAAQTANNSLEILQELVDGGDLGQFISGQDGTPVDDMIASSIFVQVCRALAYLHGERCLHRDLKPSNIFLTKSGMVKLGDFGVSKLLTDSTVTNRRTCVGSPYYMAPEICEGQDYNAKADVWSLGCVLFELCAAARPFEAPNLGALVLRITRNNRASLPQTVSSPLEKIINSLLVADQTQRPTVGELLEEAALQPFVKSPASRLCLNVAQALGETSTSASHDGLGTLGTLGTVDSWADGSVLGSDDDSDLEKADARPADAPPPRAAPAGSAGGAKPPTPPAPEAAPAERWRDYRGEIIPKDPSLELSQWPGSLHGTLELTASTVQGSRTIAPEATLPPATRVKRADSQGEKTLAGERTLGGEKTRSGERTLNGEKTLVGERTLFGEKTRSGERAPSGEKTRSGERTLSGEKTRSGERAPSGEKTLNGDSLAPRGAGDGRRSESPRGRPGAAEQGAAREKNPYGAGKDQLPALAGGPPLRRSRTGEQERPERGAGEAGRRGPGGAQGSSPAPAGRPSSAGTPQADDDDVAPPDPSFLQHGLIPFNDATAVRKKPVLSSQIAAQRSKPARREKSADQRDSARDRSRQLHAVSAATLGVSESKAALSPRSHASTQGRNASTTAFEKTRDAFYGEMRDPRGLQRVSQRVRQRPGQLPPMEKATITVHAPQPARQQPIPPLLPGEEATSDEEPPARDGGAQRGAHRERGEKLRSGPLGSGRGTPPEKLQSAYPGRSTPDSSRGGAQRFSAALQDGKEMVALRAGSRRR